MAAMVEQPPVPPPSATAEKIILGKYKTTRILGRGNFAKVYHARSIKDNRVVAIKVINKSNPDPIIETLITREVEAMRRLDHPNILRIHEVMASKTKIYMVMEYAKGGDLFTKLGRRPDHRFTEPIARRYFHQVVSALRFCHQNGVAHRDVKLQNLLLDDEGNVKVADFGLSGVVVDPTRNLTLQTACGTPSFAAPEIIGRRARARVGYDGCKADAWSCGVILFVMLTGFLPFDDSNLVLMYRRMHKRDFHFPSWVSKPARSLIFRLLDPNPKTRAGIEQIMDDPWIKIHGFMCSRSVSLGDIASLEEKKNQGSESSSSMNAFEIISMSSGLDLSGIFDEGMTKRVKRYTSREGKGVVVDKVVEVGRKLGYEVEKREKGSSGSCCVVLGKGRLVLTIVVSEVAPELVVVELKAVNGCVLGLDKDEELQWGELTSELGHMVVSVHESIIDEHLKFDS